MSLRMIKDAYWRTRTDLRFRYSMMMSDIFGPSHLVWNKPVVFIHIPKAAGSSIASLGVGYTFGHKTYAYYDKWRPRDRIMPITFAVVRNPLDRFVSAFHYLAQGRGNGIDRAWALKNNLIGRPIDDFAINDLPQDRILRWMHFKPQVDFTAGPRSIVAVDHVLRFETIERDWAALATRYDLPTCLPQKNSSVGNKACRLGEEAAAVVRRVYAEDFSVFGYSSDIGTGDAK